jgi:hypothetical protein
VDGENGVSGVVILIEKGLQLASSRLWVKAATPASISGTTGSPSRPVRRGHQGSSCRGKGGPEFHLPFQALFFLLETDGFFLVLPDFGPGELAVQVFEAVFFAVEVKDNLGAR